MAHKKTSSVQEAQNAAKTLYANINFSSVDEPIKSIVITSTIPNEGKSTVALYLAEAAAQSGKRTLLVECDMRRRSLANMLGAHARYGIHAVLSGQIPLEQAVVGTPSGARFLDAEPRVPNPADLLQSKRFSQLVKTMEDSYDFVVIDTPPVGTFVDAAIVAAQADATALVIRENFTKRAEVLNALDQLRKADANVIGSVMNYCDAQSSEYYYAYYNKDGKRVKKHHHGSDGPEPLPIPMGAPTPAPAQPVSAPVYTPSVNPVNPAPVRGASGGAVAARGKHPSTNTPRINRKDGRS